MEKTTLSRAEKLDRIFGTPVYAVLLAIFCNVLWGSAFPFIKLGYRLFAIDSSNTPSILCFAGVRFMLGSFLVLLGSVLLQNRVPRFPRGKVAAECCDLGLWQTTTQYAFYYIAVAKNNGGLGVCYADTGGRKIPEYEERAGSDDRSCTWRSCR